MSRQDTCGICGRGHELVECIRCHSFLHAQVSLTKCVGCENDHGRTRWMCPPCGNETDAEDQAVLEDWSEERKVRVMERLMRERQRILAPRPAYQDPLPGLKQLSDFPSDPSDPSEEEVKYSGEIQIGPQFQARLPRFGEVSAPNRSCARIWEVGRLNNHDLEVYMQRARAAWEASYLHLIKPFNVADACTVLHVKMYDVDAALQAIAREHLPYIAVCEHETVARSEDLEALRQRSVLLHLDPRQCHLPPRA